MTVTEFLASLREQDIRVWLEGERVRVNAPTGRLTPELQKELAARKAEIRSFLSSLEAGASETPASAPVEKAAVEGEFPVSFAQRRLWFVDHLEPGSRAYNVAASRALSGELDVGLLEASLGEMVRRQGSLRTVFREVNEEPVQVVEPFRPPVLERIDLTQLPPGQHDDEVQRLKQVEAAKPFDIEGGPLFRATLITLSPTSHMLLFSMHHIVCDGWSLGIFLQELHAHYEALKFGRPLELAPLAIQYGEYSTRQRERLAGAELDRLLGYWVKKFEGAAPMLALPTDRPRPPRVSYEGATTSFAFSPELSAALRALARRENATLYMTLLAVFKILLYRYSGQSDIVVGTPIATRDSPELEGVIGLFVSTLAIRSDLGGDPSVRAFVRETRENVLEAQAHRDLPFEKLVEALRPARTMAWSPIFQVAFVLQNTPLSSAFDVTSAAAMYDLTLFVWDDQAEIRGVFEYSTALFDAATIERMAQHLRVLAENAMENPEAALTQVPMLPTAEREQLLLDWSSRPSAYPRDASLPALFDAMAAAQPDAVALENVDPSREFFPLPQLTYGELAQVSETVASRLRAKGVRPGAYVGVYMDRSVGAVVSMLAVLKAGAAYVPLDTGNPDTRTRDLLAAAGVGFVITQFSRASKLQNLKLPVLVIEDLWRTAASVSGAQGAAEIGAESDAYVMFTSGTTGVPKGVRVTHRNIVRLVRNTNYVTLGADDVVLQFASLAFDASTFEIWGALLNGARLVVHPSGVPTTSELAETLEAKRISTLWLTAGLFHLIVDEELQALAKVRQVLAGGDVLSAPHVQRLLDAKQNGVVINGYGPTENTTFTCCHVMRPGTRMTDAVPIGLPIANTTVYILDSRGEPVPVGVPGDLVTGGDGVARGYLGDAAASAQKFVPDPFSKLAGATMYRTGDRARWRADGTVEFLGRNDRQVKVRGYRIELAEIEDVLRSCGSVRDAAVITIRDAAGTNALVAYIVPRVGGAVDKVEIRRSLTDRLPGYMIPAEMLALSSLPLTANGKLDRAALPEPTAKARVVVEPRTMMETQLRAIWEHVLGYSGFGVHDNFFELGGHSLLALRIFVQVERVFGRKLPASVLFEAPTIEQLAARLAQDGFAARWDSLVTIQPEGTKPPLFMVPGIGGNVVIYSELARLLGRDQPLYGLQSRGLDGQEMPFDRVEAIAAHFIEEIRRFKPHGPYYLGGACFGGAVAYEMAQQLEAQGEEVAFLMLLETWRPPVHRPIIDTLLRHSHHVRFLMSAGRRHLAQIMVLSPRNLAGALVERSKVIGEMIMQKDLYRGDSAALYVDRVSTANEKAFGRYVPRPYEGEVHLVLASERKIYSKDDPRLYWTRFARGGYQRHDIPARDSGLILKSPHVEKLAAWLSEALRAAQGKGTRRASASKPLQASIHSLSVAVVSLMMLF
ncbi:MAG: amino acid adenylation domain-containing protein [Gammaproteobacteria bacterium]